MNESQPAPAPSPTQPTVPVTPVPAMVPPPAMTAQAAPQSHMGILVGLISVVVICALLATGYWYMMQSNYHTPSPPPVIVDPSAVSLDVTDPSVALLEAELQAESLDDLGAELEAIEQELAP